jgi:hypothetical protein
MCDFATEKLDLARRNGAKKHQNGEWFLPIIEPKYIRFNHQTSKTWMRKI